MNALFTKSLLLVLAFDAVSSLTIIVLYGYGYQLWLVAIPLFVGIWLVKRTKAAIALLTDEQRRVRFIFQAGGVIIMFTLVLKWALRINNRAAWCISSFVFIFLLVQLYLEWVKYGESCGKDFLANQLSVPTSASVTPAAVQPPRQPWSRIISTFDGSTVNTGARSHPMKSTWFSQAANGMVRYLREFTSSLV
jgi:hypothetical protein